jgi:hypothetical protein
MSDFNAATEDHPPRDRQATTSPAPDSFVPDQRVIAGSGSQMATETRTVVDQHDPRPAGGRLERGFGLFFVRSVCLYRLRVARGPVPRVIVGHAGPELRTVVQQLAADAPRARFFEVTLFATSSSLHDRGVRHDAAPRA